MRLLLALLIATFSLGAIATEVRTLDERLRDVDQHCFQRDWAKTQCEFERSDAPTTMGEPYKRLVVVDDLTTLVLDLVKRYGLDSTFYYVRRFAAELGITSDPEAIERRLNFVKLKTDAQNVADRNQLSSCQRACLANCISAHAIDYMDDSEAQSLVPADTLARGYGLCQHFSTMASFLSHSFGNQYTFAVTSLQMGHEFVLTQLGDAWWFSEPQDDRCKFYPAPNDSL